MLVEAGSHLYQMGRYICARDALLRAHDLLSNGTSFMDVLSLLLYETVVVVLFPKMEHFRTKTYI